MWQVILPAITIGFLGSLHCAGMCGPIVMALPIGGRKGIHKAMAILTYNSGRILVYALMGLLFGMLGKGFAMAGLQQGLSLVAGFAVILAVLLPTAWKRFFPLSSVTDNILLKLKSSFATYLKIDSATSRFTIGMLNGLLPCGLVYFAITGALVTGTPAMGALFMILFGIGTLPMMFAIGYTSDWVRKTFTLNFQKLVPVVLVIMGVMLVIRGLSLGIPYISPDLNACATGHVNCCHK